MFVLFYNIDGYPTLKSVVLSHFGNRRFCLIFEIGGFVLFQKSVDPDLVELFATCNKELEITSKR